MNRPRILLADDHTLIAEGISKLIEPEFDLIGIVQDGRTLLDKIGQLAPDILLLDISLPLINGIEAAHRIKKLSPTVKVIFLTMHAEPFFIKDAASVGASGYVLKQSAAGELIYAIRQALEGRTYFATTTTPEEIEQGGHHSPQASQETPSPVDSVLTPRQREILQLVAEGHSNKEIARLLNLSLKTIEFHKNRIMRTVGVKRTADLTKYAISHRIVTP